MAGACGLIATRWAFIGLGCGVGFWSVTGGCWGLAGAAAHGRQRRRCLLGGGAAVMLHTSRILHRISRIKEGTIREGLRFEPRFWFGGTYLWSRVECDARSEVFGVCAQNGRQEAAASDEEISGPEERVEVLRQRPSCASDLEPDSEARTPGPSAHTLRRRPQIRSIREVDVAIHGVHPDRTGGEGERDVWVGSGQRGWS
eukprot:1704078-Rhodomonas_salina.3